jgi:hypothetical protein
MRIIYTIKNRWSLNAFITLVPYFLLIIVIGFWYFESKICTNIAPRSNTFGSSSVLIKDKIEIGYTLFATIGEYKGKTLGNEKVSLIDIYGKEIHHWIPKDQPFQAQLEKNGNLMVLLMPSATGDMNSMVTKRKLQELDWNNHVIWEYENDGIHHDFEPLSNGNIAIIKYNKVPSNIATQVKGGITSIDSPDVFADSIIEINRQGKTIWQWDLYKYLNPEEDKIGDFDLHGDWTHSNSIRFLDKNPINGGPAYLLSVRNLNFTAIISRQTGEILWRSPKGLLDHQHDASLLENGNILIFDNGFSEHAKTDALLESSLKEINPKTNQVVWKYEGTDYLEKSHFYNSTLGGVQKLKNGNVLITQGINGELMEITPSGKMVWFYINPNNVNPKSNFFKNYIYKARRIHKEDINWPVDIDSPAPLISSFCKG